MNKLKSMPYYIILALMCGAALLHFQGPFYEQALVMALASVPIMLFISRKQIPLFLFGVLLVSIGFAVYEPVHSLSAIGTYFLLSVFQFSLWSTTDQVKRQMEETELLKKQRQILLQKNGELRVLSLQEFVEQAFWLLKTNNHQERTWLMEVVLAIDCPVQMEKMKRAVLVSIDREHDLVTSKHGAVYLLVKGTEQEALQPLMQRMKNALETDGQSVGYKINKKAITKACEMGSLLD